MPRVAGPTGLPGRSLPLSRITPCLLGLVLAIAAAAMPGRAEAHAILLASTPPAGGTVSAGEVALSFRYNSRIDRGRSLLRLTRPDKSQASLAIQDSGPPDVLETRADLAPGAYTVRWQVLAVDGHITRGDVSFTVGPKR